MQNLPFLLIYLRIALGAVVGILALTPIENKATWIVTCTVVGLLTDIFDGVIARKYNVVTEKLRVWDSNVDQFFWLIVIASIFYLNLGFVGNHWLGISLVVLAEVLCYAVSYIRFQKPIATHSVLARIWTLSLLAFLIDLVLNGQSSFFYGLCIVLGLISRLEILFIILLLKQWTTDVSSVFKVFELNRTPNK